MHETNNSSSVVNYSDATVVLWTEQSQIENISIDNFTKLDMRMSTVIKVEKLTKLINLAPRKPKGQISVCQYRLK